jgi:type VI secretion system protein ImpA
MPELDVDGLTRPLGGESPCGPDLEYDPAFLEMIGAAKAPPERAVAEDGATPAETQWPVVLKKARELSERTRDLRVAILLTQSLLNTSGLVAAAEGAAVLRQLLTNSWDGVHPRLDPADNNDPTMRVNALTALADSQGFLKALRQATIVQSPQAGRFSLRDHRIAQGALPAPEGAPKPDAAHIQGAFDTCPVEELKATADAVNTLREAFRTCDDLLKAKLNSQSPDLSALLGDIEEIHGLVTSHLASRTGAPATGSVAAAGGAVITATPGGPIASTGDVIKRLNEICDYYRRHEPSSPIPLLLERAQRLVNKDFAEIIRDLAPAGVDQVVTIAGKPLEGAEQRPG